jgi:hypothetical protein
MGRHAENAKVQENACGALWNLAADHRENQAKIGAQVENRHGYICEYIWPLHTGVEDKCRNEQSQTHTRTQGGIEAVVTAMGRHAESSRLQESACGALWNLAADHRENTAKIGAQVESIHQYICEYIWPLHTGVEDKCRNEQSQTHTRTQGGIEAVVTAMRRHAENAKVQEIACAALGTLAASYSRENQAKIGAQVENRHEYI